MTQPKHVIVLDWESYYDTKQQYSLTSLTTTEYIRDSRFEAHGFGISLDGSKARWFTGPKEKLQRDLENYPIEDSLVVAHNAIFDGAILEWIFNRKPLMYFCTMMASRPHIVPFTYSMSLASVNRYLGTGEKGDVALRTSGYRRANLPAQLLRDLGTYCCDDVNQTRDNLVKLWPTLPEDERYLLDLTIKKFTRPVLHLDPDVLKARHEQVMNAKAKALLMLPTGVTKTHLMSNDKFAAVLGHHLGEMPPRKISPTTGKITWAFSKQDEEFNDLLVHEKFPVRALVQARLALKSTLEETRIQRLLNIHAVNGGLLPVPLLYYGAHTGRLSGIDSLNLQNLPRPKKGVIGIRHALVAPEGYQVVTVDLSQIEARIVAALAGARDLLKEFSDPKGDPYSAFATRVYGYPVDKKNFPVERFVGKGCILGLGYGVGAPKLLKTLRAQAAAQGITLQIDLDDSKRFVQVYRNTNFQIPDLWKELGRVVISKMLRPGEPPLLWKMLEISHHKLVLPNGMPIYYDDLRQIPGTRDTGYAAGKKADGTQITQYLWGGSLLENITQALARIIISRAEIRLARAGLISCLQVHDELVYVVRNEHVERVRRALNIALTDPVPWLPNVPLACEVGVGPSYGTAK